MGRGRFWLSRCKNPAENVTCHSGGDQKLTPAVVCSVVQLCKHCRGPEFGGLLQVGLRTSPCQDAAAPNCRKATKKARVWLSQHPSRVPGSCNVWLAALLSHSAPAPHHPCFDTWPCAPAVPCAPVAFHRQSMQRGSAEPRSTVARHRRSWAAIRSEHCWRWWWRSAPPRHLGGGADSATPRAAPKRPKNRGGNRPGCNCVSPAQLGVSVPLCENTADF